MWIIVENPLGLAQAGVGLFAVAPQTAKKALPVPGYGTWFLPLATTIWSPAKGIHSPSGFATWSIPIPNSTRYRGVSMAVQGAVWDRVHRWSLTRTALTRITR